MSIGGYMQEIRLYQETDDYNYYYPVFAELADKQMDIFWKWDEYNVEKDKQDFLVGMTDSEKHGVNTVLKLFTKYELFIGNEYWSTVVAKRYPRPEIQRMTSCFSHVENNSHAPFYNQLNKVIGLNTPEFYSSYVEDAVLLERMQFLQSALNNEDKLLSVAAFSLIEGAVLYSSFGYLKHFQSNGKNKLLNVCRGVNASAIDENLHCIGGAYLYNLTLKEVLEINPDYDKAALEREIIKCAIKVFEHESRIIDMIFEKGEIKGITAHQLREFVKSRINVCLNNLNMPNLYEVQYNPIAEWFYNGINNYQMNDFFSGVGREYQRNWVKTDFIFVPKKK